MDDWQQMVYACKSYDQSVSVIVPAKDFKGTEKEWLELTELDAIDDYLVLYPIQVPGDRYFREAWEIVDDAIQVNLEKAKRIHIEYLCRERDERLRQLDIETLTAFEKGSIEKLERVIDLKEALRNMPEDDGFNVTDIDALRKFRPSCLDETIE